MGRGTSGSVPAAARSAKSSWARKDRGAGWSSGSSSTWRTPTYPGRHGQAEPGGRSGVPPRRLAPLGECQSAGISSVTSWKAGWANEVMTATLSGERFAVASASRSCSGEVNRRDPGLGSAGSEGPAWKSLASANCRKNSASSIRRLSFCVAAWPLRRPCSSSVLTKIRGAIIQHPIIGAPRQRWARSVPRWGT